MLLLLLKSQCVRYARSFHMLPIPALRTFTSHLISSYILKLTYLAASARQPLFRPDRAPVPSAGGPGSCAPPLRTWTEGGRSRGAQIGGGGSEKKGNERRQPPPAPVTKEGRRLCPPRPRSLPSLPEMAARPARVGPVNVFLEAALLVHKALLECTHLPCPV